MAPIVLQFSDISTYCGRSIRPIEEGSLLASSPHLMQVACTLRDKQRINYTALCLQTSNTTGKPHTVDLYLELTAANGKRIQGSCSCKANISKCKHILALMLKLMNKDPTHIDVLSRTDVTQSWGKYSAKCLEELQPKRIAQMDCCYKQKLGLGIPNDAHFPENVNHCVEAFPNSILARIFNSNSTPVISKAIETPPPQVSYNEIFPDYDGNSVSKLRLEGEKKFVKFYYKFVNVDFEKASNIYERTRGQSKNNSWKVQRKLRITGSICHSLFTFSKKNYSAERWSKKLKTTFFGTSKSNKYMKFGSRNEKKALNIFKTSLENDETMYTNCGLVVNRNFPYLGASPDGFIKSNGKLVLLEVKCPYPKKKFDKLRKFTKSLKFIDYETRQLKTTNQYYSQVQLTMFLTNVDAAKLIVYHKRSESVISIDVEKDEAYCLALANVLTNCYATKVLPFLCEKNNMAFIREMLKKSFSE